MPLIAALTILLSFLFVWLPYKQAREERIRRDFEEKLEVFKLIAVRRYYKSLKKLSFEEIQERYNVDFIYNMIGKV